MTDPSEQSKSRRWTLPELLAMAADPATHAGREFEVRPDGYFHEVGRDDRPFMNPPPAADVFVTRAPPSPDSAAPFLNPSWFEDEYDRQEAERSVQEYIDRAVAAERDRCWAVARNFPACGCPASSHPCPRCGGARAIAHAIRFPPSGGGT